MYWCLTTITSYWSSCRFHNFVISSWNSISQSIKIDHPLYSDKYGVRNLEVEKSVESNGPLGRVRIPSRCSLFISVIDSGEVEYLLRESISSDVAALSLLSYPMKILIIS